MPNNQIKWLVKKSDTFPCFLWPIVEKEDGSLYLPLSNDKQKVTSFRKIDSIDGFTIRIPVPDTDITIEEGAETIFAYAFNETIFFYDTLKIFSQEIKEHLNENPEAVGTDVFKQYALDLFDNLEI